MVDRGGCPCKHLVVERSKIDTHRKANHHFREVLAMPRGCGLSSPEQIWLLLLLLLLKGRVMKCMVLVLGQMMVSQQPFTEQCLLHLWQIPRKKEIMEN